MITAHTTKIPVPIDGKTYLLETRIYRPSDVGQPLPLIVMTHGRDGATPRVDHSLIEQYEFFNQELASFGFVVAYVVRRGYGGSDGPDSEYLITPEASGLAGAYDLQAAVGCLQGLDYVDQERVAIVGHSQGGWIALAASTLEIAGLRGAVNISGAINFGEAIGSIRSAGVEGPLQRSAAAFGSESKVRVLWLYDINDNHTEPSIRRWFHAFCLAGGNGELLFRYNPSTNRGFGHGLNAQTYCHQNELLKFFGEIGLK